MSNWKDLGIYGLLLFICFILIIEIVAVGLIAGAIASCFGFTGILWWIVAVGIVLIINAILNVILNSRR